MPLSTLARLIWAVLKSTFVYCLLVAGGLTLFLILSPVFGYLPYSDRPGPGWHGSFPALTWREFWANTGSMLEFGLFFAILLAPAGAICTLVVRGLGAASFPPLMRHVLAGVAAIVVTGYFVAAIGWYVALGVPGLVVSITFGVAACTVVLPTLHRAEQT